MSDKTNNREIVHKLIRKCTVDLQQAESYYDNSQYEGYEKNLLNVIQNLGDLIEKTKSKID